MEGSQGKIKLFQITPGNVSEHGIFCIKNKSSSGYLAKKEWFCKNYSKGLRMIIAHDEKDKPVGFIEYVAGEEAWRPVNAYNYHFIHCIMVYPNAMRNSNTGSMLIDKCIQDSIHNKKYGVCTMVSTGAWIAEKTIFEKNGFKVGGAFGRFELMIKKFDNKYPDAELVDWNRKLKKFKGWNLVYADQCPWHEKAVKEMKLAAGEFGINLKVIKLMNAKEAQKAPSGFGVFSLVKDGKLLEDHYLSKTRFTTILKEELGLQSI